MALVELVQCGNRIEAALLQDKLEAEGVPSFLFDAEMSWVGAILQCRLMVDADDLAQAKRVLADWQDG